MSKTYNDIALGEKYSFTYTFTKESERLFGELTGDTTEGPGGTVHGMLAASLFSTLIDTYGPGPESVYVTQTLQFRRPIQYGSTVSVVGNVIEKSDSTNIVTLGTEITLEGQVLISGEARIKL